MSAGFPTIRVTLDKFLAEVSARRKAGRSLPTWDSGGSTATHFAYLFPDGKGFTEFRWLVHKAELRAHHDRLAQSAK